MRERALAPCDWRHRCSETHRYLSIDKPSINRRQRCTSISHTAASISRFVLAISCVAASDIAFRTLRNIAALSTTRYRWLDSKLSRFAAFGPDAVFRRRFLGLSQIPKATGVIRLLTLYISHSIHGGSTP